MKESFHKNISQVFITNKNSNLFNQLPYSQQGGQTSILSSRQEKTSQEYCFLNKESIHSLKDKDSINNISSNSLFDKNKSQYSQYSNDYSQQSYISQMSENFIPSAHQKFNNAKESYKLQVECQIKSYFQNEKQPFIGKDQIQATQRLNKQQSQKNNFLKSSKSLHIIKNSPKKKQNGNRFDWIQKKNAIQNMIKKQKKLNLESLSEQQSSTRSQEEKNAALFTSRSTDKYLIEKSNVKLLEQSPRDKNINLNFTQFMKKLKDKPINNSSSDSNLRKKNNNSKIKGSYYPNNSNTKIKNTNNNNNNSDKKSNSTHNFLNSFQRDQNTNESRFQLYNQSLTNRSNSDITINKEQHSLNCSNQHLVLNTERNQIQSNHLLTQRSQDDEDYQSTSDNQNFIVEDKSEKINNFSTYQDNKQNINSEERKLFQTAKIMSMKQNCNEVKENGMNIKVQKKKKTVIIPLFLLNLNKNKHFSTIDLLKKQSLPSDNLPLWNLSKEYYVIQESQQDSNIQAEKKTTLTSQYLLFKKSDFSLWEATTHQKNCSQNQYIKDKGMIKVFESKIKHQLSSIQQKSNEKKDLEQEKQKLTLAENTSTNSLNRNLKNDYYSKMDFDLLNQLTYSIINAQQDRRCYKLLPSYIINQHNCLASIRQFAPNSSLKELLSKIKLLNEKLIIIIFKQVLEALTQVFNEVNLFTRIDASSIYFGQNCEVLVSMNIFSNQKETNDLSYLKYISSIHNHQCSLQSQMKSYLSQFSSKHQESQCRDSIKILSENQKQSAGTLECSNQENSQQFNISKQQLSDQQNDFNFQQPDENGKHDAQQRQLKSQVSEDNMYLAPIKTKFQQQILLDEKEIVFEIGYLILKSLIGLNYSLIKSSFFFSSKFKAFSQGHRNHIKNNTACCFYHDLTFLKEQNSTNNQLVSEKTCIEVRNFLQKNCSNSLLTLICGCLRYKREDRMSLHDVSQSLKQNPKIQDDRLKELAVLRHLFEQIRTNVQVPLSSNNEVNLLLKRIHIALQSNKTAGKEQTGHLARQLAIKFNMHTHEILSMIQND